MVLVDYIMPDKDGVQTTREIRAGGYLGIIVGISGLCLKESEEAFAGAGANKVFEKPVRGAEILALVEQVKAALSRP